MQTTESDILFFVAAKSCLDSLGSLLGLQKAVYVALLYIVLMLLSTFDCVATVLWLLFQCPIRLDSHVLCM